MIKCFEANYPESLGVVLVHRSPWIFHGKLFTCARAINRRELSHLGIWKIIKGWLDPVVASKIHFTKTIEEFQEFVEKSHIPKELGGDDPWSYHYVEPVPGENKATSNVTTRQQLLDQRASLVKEYETATQQWIRDSNARAGWQQKRAELTERLRSSYWELDPYLRARTLYDRTGMIREGGKIQFYEPPNSAPAAAQNGPLPAGQLADDLD